MKKTITWILIITFILSSVPASIFATTGASEQLIYKGEPTQNQNIANEAVDASSVNEGENKKNTPQTETYQKLPQEDLRNPAGIPSDRRNFFMKEDD
ncbi:MAG: hypothetical protein AAGU27_28520, partial [Dehalobacterium sp.]